MNSSSFKSREFCPDCAYGMYDLCGHEPPVSRKSSDAHIVLDTGGMAALTSSPDAASSDSSSSKTVTNEGNSLRSEKPDELVTDAASTGRKRAAVLYPIADGAVCEWSNLANAGGGKHPIVGCVGNPASNRHHGPDKNTLNNSEGNVHRICTHCHNLWHYLNDEDYDPRRGHKPRSATPEEIMRWNVLKDYTYE